MPCLCGCCPLTQLPSPFHPAQIVWGLTDGRIPEPPPNSNVRIVSLDQVRLTACGMGVAVGGSVAGVPDGLRLEGSVAGSGCGNGGRNPQQPVMLLDYKPLVQVSGRHCVVPASTAACQFLTLAHTCSHFCTTHPTSPRLPG